MTTQTLKNVQVDKISLVSAEQTPAVPKATTKYALFKKKNVVDSVHKLDKILDVLENHRDLKKTKRLDDMIATLKG